MQIRKFFDKDDKEVPANDAIKCHEVEIDDEDGSILKEAWYFVRGEELRYSRGRQTKKGVGLSLFLKSGLGSCNFGYGGETLIEGPLSRDVKSIKDE